MTRKSLCQHGIPGSHSTGSPLVKTSCSNGQEVDSADSDAFHCSQRDRSSGSNGFKIAARVVAAGHRDWKPPFPNTQRLGSGAHDFLETRRLDHFPYQAGLTPIWCNHKGVAAHIRLGLPVGDHAQPETVDFDVVQNRP